MDFNLFANFLYEIASLKDNPEEKRVLLRAMPLMLGVLCILAIAYRYYSAFLAAKVACLDDARTTPAHQFNDGQNYHPTNRWVLFGHHFAAISGAGPLIGPVLAMQYGYAPGLLWLVIGVCLAGAVQDMLVMAASVRRGGKSLVEIARQEVGPTASLIASISILFIVIIALAGLSFVVVKALGGEDAKLPAGMKIILPKNETYQTNPEWNPPNATIYAFPKGCSVIYSENQKPSARPEEFRIKVPADKNFQIEEKEGITSVILPAKCAQAVPGSCWGTFTIACTIPIALFVGLWMYRLRKGRVIEASIIGGLATLGAVALGAEIKGSSLESIFTLSRETTILSLCIYGFVAAVLPVWLLLTPRDYLSSFMKIGTLALLVVGVIIANPSMRHPPLNESFRAGGPMFPGDLFPFVFICVMCGAISGFHSLVSSGTTPKMINRERDIRPIGYGAMLTEGLVGVVALIAAASMPVDAYLAMNTDIERLANDEKLRAKVEEVKQKYETVPEAQDPVHRAGVHDIKHLDLGQMEELVGGESLRGRTGGAVTLAVSMATILTNAFSWADDQLAWLMKYWYHFAIMFEALFILTTIDAGTRIARYIFQEAFGKIYSPLSRTDWLPGVLLASACVTAGWGWLVHTGNIGTIWPMFGIANQLLAVMALALVTTWLLNSGKKWVALVTLLPMLWVSTTTLTAGRIMVGRQLANIQQNVDATVNGVNMGLTLFVMVTVLTVVLIAISRWLVIVRGWANIPRKPV